MNDELNICLHTQLMKMPRVPNNKLYTLSAYLGLTGFYKLPG